ncbi:MAG: ABC transporter permease [Planctomycetota bacterium]|nr:ABC transporter permease [Planctomycetota bacterium]
MAERIVWEGELVARRGLYARGAALLAGGMGFIALLLALPSLALVALAFATRGTYGDVVWSFSLDQMKRLAGYGILGWSPDLLWILARSVAVAGVTTALCILLAFPLAFFVASRPPSRRYLWLALVVVPMLTNLVIRTYGWFPILGTHSPLTALARGAGLLNADESLYPGALAVYLGMVSGSLPFAVLPLYAAAERLDGSLVDAARDLYGGRWLVFRHAILPQVRVGLAVATILTFVPALGAFVIPDLLGGARYMLMGNLIQQQFFAARNWPFGAAVSLALLGCSLCGLFLYWRAQLKDEQGARA